MEAVYVVPNVLDQATCIFMHYINSGRYLFNNNPWTYTRCQEKAWGTHQISVGSFFSDGLSVCDANLGYSYISVAALRKFS